MNKTVSIYLLTTCSLILQVSDSDMTPILRATDVKAVLHGTKMAHWSLIKTQVA